MKYIYTFALVLFFAATSSAQQMVYKPLNPAFGGDTFNYNWLISSANAQNGFTAPQSARDQQSDLERFGENINAQILAQISRGVLQSQLEGLGDFTEEGSFTFGTLAIEVFESSEGLVINILDIATGEQTQVIVPN